MIIQHGTETPVILSGTSTISEFGIKESAKAYAILSSGLYKNKIRAIIRELSCNAVDSHTAAGKADVPFEVHLPTALEPFFYVKDWGTGLDHAEVSKIYTTYFESTKTNSNEFIGALGLGSKSPFSYTNNFTVTAIKNGICRIYGAFISDTGRPSVVLMSEDETDEPNGVEVRFSVENSSDYGTFYNETAAVLRWFSSPYQVTGADITVQEVNYISKDLVPGVHQTSSHTSYALMGNIAYPIDNIPDPSRLNGLNDLLRYGLVIECGIGELDFAASREELSFIELTYNTLRSKLQVLSDSLYQILTDKVSQMTCEYEKTDYLVRTNSGNLSIFHPSAVRYITETQNPYLEARYSKLYFKDFAFSVDDLAKDGLSVDVSNISYGKVSHQKPYYSSSGGKQQSFIINRHTIFVLNEGPRGCRDAAIRHIKTIHNSAIVVTVSHNAPDAKDRKVHYDKFLAKLHNPTNVIMSSTLPKKLKTQSDSVTSTGYLKLSRKSYSYYQSKYVWKAVDEPTDTTKAYVYIDVSGQIALDKNGDRYNVSNLMQTLRDCGIGDLSSIELYGVRKSAIGSIKGKKNWIHYTDYISKHLKKLSAKDVMSSVIDATVGKSSVSLFKKEIASNLSDDSLFKIFYDEYISCLSKSISNGQNAIAITRLSHEFACSFQINTLIKKFEDDYKATMSRYPLLAGLSYSIKNEHIIEYVKLIDSAARNSTNLVIDNSVTSS